MQALFNKCKTRDVPGAYTAYDVRTEPGEGLIHEFASGNIETITDAAKTLYTDGLQQQTRGALFITGYGRRALCHQTCVAKMQKGLFEEDKYKVVVVASEDEDDPDRPMENAQKYKLAKNFQEGVCDVQLGAEEEAQIEREERAARCSCPFCTDFAKKYVHELDIFAGAIWILGLCDVPDYAEYRAIYVYGAATLDDGLFEGAAVCQDDLDDVSELVAELRQRQAQKVTKGKKK